MWLRSAHTKLLDISIISALRKITWCLKPTPASHLPLLACIAPAHLRRDADSIKLAKKYSRSDYHQNHVLENCAIKRLKSQRPFPEATTNLMNTLKQDETTISWIHPRWSEESTSSPHYLPTLPESSTCNTLSNLSRLAWVTLNRLRTHVSRFRKTLHKRGLSANLLYSCNSGEDQMALHIIEGQCSLFRPPGRPPNLADPRPTLRGWLEETSLEV